MVTQAKLDVKGLAEYLETIARAGLDIDAAAQRALMAGSAVLHDGMDALVPEDKGDLRAAIVVDGPHQDGNFNYVEVGVIHNKSFTSKEVAIYGNVQEYGSPSKNIPAHSYIRAGIDAKRRAWFLKVRESLKAEGLAD